MKNLLPIYLLVLTVILNGFIFSKQLDYGFRDVDWQVLYYFKLFDGLSLTHLPQAFGVLGVYISESYYVGLLEKFLGLNFVHLHQVTHIFKIIAAISVYVMILKIFKRKLLAFISSLIYTASYTHAGVLFQLSSGGYFLTTIFMNSFLIAYYYSLTRESILKWSTVTGILLILTIILKPERMYPLIPLILLIEFSVVALRKFKKDILTISLKRVFITLLPVIVLSLFYQVLFKSVISGFAPSQFSIGSNMRIDSIIKGNLQLLLYPFASLGSIFLYEDYWKILGQLSFQNLGSYLTSLIFGPVIRLVIVTFILLLFVHKKPLRLTAFTTAGVLFFGLIIYILQVNWQNINPLTRVHFDPNFLAIPAIFGFYILSLGSLFTVKWIRDRDQRILPLILGFSSAFLFILLTWLPSDLQLTFMGPQRYLSIPSIGTSLFISGLLVIAFDRLKQIKFTKQFSWIIFLLLIPMFIVNYQVTNKFFEDELNFAGVRATEQARMKNRLRLLMGEVDTQDKSLFYFDETQDPDNAYFNEGTVLAGFEYWIKINKDGTLNNLPTPGMIRSTRQCPEHTYLSCIKVLKDGLETENGDKGIWYADSIRGNIQNFYKINNFHAYRFVNKNIIDIRDEVLKELNL